jgi:hypothetical protein
LGPWQLRLVRWPKEVVVEELELAVSAMSQIIHKTSGIRGERESIRESSIYAPLIDVVFG